MSRQMEQFPKGYSILSRDLQLFCHVFTVKS